MTQFTIGQAGQQKLQIDLPRLVDTKALVQANSGGGKSWLLRIIAEQSITSVPVIILDPEGEFATLRERYDFALVGRDGEMRTDVQSAALLAHKLVEFRVPAIINLADLESLDEKRQYVRIFLESLISVPRKLWGPMLVLIDEAHRFAPKQGEAESTDAVVTLIDAGRKRGFAGIVATQRLSKLHNDVAAECNNVFIGRTWLDNDQERAGDMLGMKKADRQVLRDLPQGEFFGFGPALSIPGVTRFHSATVATTHPKPGQRHQMAVPKASAHIRDIVEQLGDLPAQAEEKVAEIEQAHRRINQLELDLRTRSVQVQTKVEQVIKQVEIPVFKNGEVGRLEAAVEKLAGVGQELTAAAREVGERLKLASQPRPLNTILPAAAPTKADQLVRPASGGEEVKLQKAERRVLSALAQYPQGRTKVQLAVLTGYAVNGGGFGNAIGKLRTLGFLTGFKDNLVITQPGLDALGGAWEPLPQGRALVDHWLHELPKCERAVLGVLVNVYPKSLSKAEIAERAGYDAGGGGFGNALGKLRTLELIAGRAEMRASDSFFMEAV